MVIKITMIALHAIRDNKTVFKSIGSAKRIVKSTFFPQIIFRNLFLVIIGRIFYYDRSPLEQIFKTCIKVLWHKKVMDKLCIGMFL